MITLLEDLPQRHDKDLKKKTKQLDKLVKVMKIATGKLLTREQNADINTMQERLQFRLNSLVLNCKLKELDVKIGAYQEVIDFLK